MTRDLSSPICSSADAGRPWRGRAQQRGLRRPVGAVRWTVQPADRGELLQAAYGRPAART